jgi:hypothetical protein
LGNKKADAASKEAAQRLYIQGPLLWEESLLLPGRPHYILSEAKMTWSQGYYLDHQGWWVSPEDEFSYPRPYSRRSSKLYIKPITWE